MIQFNFKRLSLIGYLILCLIIFGIVGLISASNRDIFISPDENTTSAFVDHYAKTGSLTMPYEFGNYSAGSILPRGTFMRDAEIIPILPIGFNIIGGTTEAVIPWLSFAIAPICLIALSLYQYQFIRLLFNNANIALGSSALLLILPPFLHFATRSRVTDVLMTLFFAIGVYYTYRSQLRKNEKLPVVLAGFFLAMAMLVNLKVVFLIASLFLGYIVWLFLSHEDVKNRIHTLSAHAGLYLIGAMLPFIALFLTNSELYGGPLKNGYTAIAQVATTTGASERPLLNINPTQMWFNVENYLFGLTLPLISVFILLGICYVLMKKNIATKEIRLSYLTLFISMTAITTLYFSNIAAWGGSGEATLTASFLRYLLPVIFIGLPMALLVVSSIKTTPKLVVFAGISAFSFWTALYYPGGYYSIRGYTQRMENTRTEILELTPNDALLITNNYDKILYPYRQTINMQAFPVVKIGNKDFPSAEMIAITISEISKNKPTVRIFYIEETAILTESLTSALKTQNFVLTNVESSSAIAIYEVKK